MYLFLGSVTGLVEEILNVELQPCDTKIIILSVLLAFIFMEQYASLLAFDLILIRFILLYVS
jgi:hypothetical protein